MAKEKPTLKSKSKTDVRRQCNAGACGADCSDGCGCISWGDTHEECMCKCYRGLSVTRNERKIPFKTFKPRIKVTPQTKFDICTYDLPIRELARILDKFLPNEIVVPVNKKTDKVTLSLKKKTFKQIINRAGLTLKSY